MQKFPIHATSKHWPFKNNPKRKSLFGLFLVYIVKNNLIKSVLNKKYNDNCTYLKYFAQKYIMKLYIVIFVLI